MKTQEPGRSAWCSLMLAPWMQRHEVGVLLLRVGVAAMMLCHGWPKLLLLVSGGGSGWLDPLGVGPVLSLALCVVAEFFCSLAVLAGCFTRAAALVLAVNFGVVVFVYGAAGSPGQSELPMLYLLCFVALVCTGSGPLAVDRLLARRLCGRYRAGDSRRVVILPRSGARNDLS